MTKNDTSDTGSGPQETRRRLQRPTTATVIFAITAMAVPLIYAAVTHHVWEDFFITFTFSRNLWEGHGLVHWPGEHVHGFTSPLGVLLPALCYGLTGATSYLPALWLFRFLMAGAFAGAGVIFLRILRRAEMPTWGCVCFALFFLFDAKSVMFSVNGMETALMLLFVSLAIYAGTSSHDKAWMALGGAWAGLMWTRPDSCVFVAVLALVDGVANRTRWRERLPFLLKSALICTVIYLPWFCWAWWYYGSPVPHTITAKAGADFSGSLIDIVRRCLRRPPPAIGIAFMPPYPFFGPWPSLARLSTKVLGLIGAVYWLIPGGNPIGRRLSAAFLLLATYLAQIPFAFPWYFPPVALLGYGAATFAAVDVAKHFVIGTRARRLGILLLTPFMAVTIVLFGMATIQMYYQQRIIESGVRTGIGNWLKEYAGPDDRVYLECLGYIGYFSKCRMLDFPGLCTPEVAHLRKEKKLSMAAVVPELKPEWLVLRGFEAEKIMDLPANRAAYREVMVVNATNTILERAFLPGRDYLLYDACFVIFRRIEATGNIPPPNIDR